MKFKLDENLGRRAAEVFRAAGHDVTTVREQGFQGGSDKALYDLCREEDRCLVPLISISATCSASRPLRPLASLSFVPAVKPPLRLWLPCLYRWCRCWRMNLSLGVSGSSSRGGSGYIRLPNHEANMPPPKRCRFPSTPACRSRILSACAKSCSRR